ncbi:phage tail protein [Aliiroseovarius lamellibrachiae]|uniref:phage tail protein n=1 Tax=Aliiroseovarius lamellibrachiae TaxID=1924933 RepID=UPI001BDF9D86|nr:phage tail protein [Aliiroseovarius lamellibrachiae]MBT2130109.1 phage tail protein [Aliiroseovarius lamellibrachiae]
MFKVGEVDVADLKQFDNLLGALGQDGPKVINRALNRTGDMARTCVVRELAKQTGLPQKTIRKAVKVKRASWQDLEYRLTSSGGDVSLKYFKARETRRGVTAFVRGERELFEGAFIKGGSFSRGRVVLNMGGHVFQRIGGRTELEKLKSGVFIPIEMVEGATAKAFEEIVADVLPRRLDHEINRSLGL